MTVRHVDIGSVSVVWTVGAAFDNFYSSINLPDTHRSTANARRDDVAHYLGSKLKVMEAFNSGSIHRYTALKRYADLDVVVALHYAKHIEGKGPAKVLQSVRDALGEYRTNVRKNGQAVTLHYKTWPNVDIVPASRVVNDNGTVIEYRIPDMKSGIWIASNPRIHSNDIEQKSQKIGPLFRRTIKMVKWWNKKHSNYLQSYHIEVIALRAFDVNPGEYSWGIFKFFDKAVDLTSAPLWHDKGFADNYLNFSDRQELLKRLKTARDIAGSAWYLTYGERNDHAEAIAKWRQLFGDKFPGYG